VQDDCIAVALRLPELWVVGEEKTDREIRVGVEYRRKVAKCPPAYRKTRSIILRGSRLR